MLNLNETLWVQIPFHNDKLVNCNLKFYVVRNERIVDVTSDVVFLYEGQESKDGCLIVREKRQDAINAVINKLSDKYGYKVHYQILR